ncbi:MAG: energy transducer TonB [Ignavibacteriaceae bacterium]
MKNQISVIILSTILFLSFLQAQDYNSNCPPLFTRSINKVPEIKITKVEVVDSNKFSTIPQFVLNKDSISELIFYPEIAKRAGVQGQVIIKINLDTNGIITNWELVKAIGAGCDEAALDFLMKSKFYPAKIGDEIVSSEVYVWFEFNLNKIADKPDLLISEIIYEDNSLFTYKKLTLNKVGDVSFIERDKTTGPSHKLLIKKNGKISTDTYERLNDFIISQCFLKYKNYYYYSASEHTRRETVTIKTDSFEKSVWSIGNGDPVGLWAIINILRHIDEQVKWEEVKE